MALRSSKSAHTPDFRGEKTETCDQDSTLADVTAASNYRGEHTRVTVWWWSAPARSECPITMTEIRSRL